jgi:hypothetical protein
MAKVEWKNVTIKAEGDLGIIEYQSDFPSRIKEFDGPSFRKGTHPLNKTRGIIINGPSMKGTFYGTIFIPKDLIVPSGAEEKIEIEGTFGMYEVHTTFMFYYSDAFTMSARITSK